MDKNIIPQIPLFTCLAKYDGQTETVCWHNPFFGTFSQAHQPDPVNRESKRYVITQLPRYLVFHMKRFTKNNWFMEKNPTIVNFPVKNLEMRPCTYPGGSSEAFSYLS